ncbi:MAG: tRNA (adenosine(37)-N6)-dimethylallyltransferase MiaA [Rickettsiaceae bacterium]|nr:MAG: tRNA (adenosine(37)-N6)-dimethylallyltransferase MiaA [Rickettsiaceae bacterium]
MQKVLIICGPTASGKTDLAHHLAQLHNGEIINADSMQIYKTIPHITASPNIELKQELPYHLYNFWNVYQPFSMSQYFVLANDKIKDVTNKQKLPIVVGGTGMYINALLYGYSDIPIVSEELKLQAREMHKRLGQEKFFALLNSLDYSSSVVLNKNDTQRSIRAYEVLLQTGKPISFYHQKIKHLSENFVFEVFFLLPERKFLYQSCDARLINIFDKKAMEEIEDLQVQYPDLNTPATKAIGIFEIRQYISGAISLEQAITQAQVRTRRYAKRQVTWFTHQIPYKQTLHYSDQHSYQNLTNMIEI